MRTETELLRLTIGRTAVKTGEGCKKLIRDWLKPSSVTELRRWSELVRLLRRFIRCFSTVASSLANLPRKHSSIQNYEKECDTAFRALKDASVSAPTMMALDWGKPFKFHTEVCRCSEEDFDSERGKRC